MTVQRSESAQHIWRLWREFTSYISWQTDVPSCWNCTQWLQRCNNWERFSDDIYWL